MKIETIRKRLAAGTLHLALVDRQRFEVDALYSAAEIAELVGVTRSTVRGWMNRYADFPEPLRISGANFWPRSVITTWLRDRGML